MTTYASTRAISKPAGRDRILVDGVDVTYVYGLAIPAPSYLLMEPFAYGSASITFPQIHGTYQASAFGTGDLSWVRNGAKVLIQRVLPDDSVVTDYRGVVLSIAAEGRSLVLEVGGQFAGVASLINQQSPLVRRVRDVGHWAFKILRTMHLPHGDEESFSDVGIDIVEGGGTTLLAWAGDVCAMSQGSDGSQYAIMPETWGGNRWEFREKDFTTVDLTIFNDDARAVLSVRNDLSEQPNAFYGTGVTPKGVRIRNGRYPGLFQGPPPEFPGSMTVGDEDADTTTGDGVSVLSNKLWGMGYIADDGPVFTSAVAAAVRELQRDADLSVTGVVNSATWDALFDISATGYSLLLSRIFPLVQDATVRPNNFTANGSFAGFNSAYDPNAIRVDRNVDFGAGVTKAAMIAWCRGQATRLAGPNWSGTIRMNRVGAFAGSWAAGSSPTSADVMSIRDIRPGMNARLPLFDGDVLVHISGVQIDDDGLSGTLTVDTLARDLLELSQIIARNAESRRSIRREWNQANRAHRPSGNMVSRDEYFGQLGQSVDCPADTWTVFPVVVGQHGQVNLTRIETTGDPAAFAMLVGQEEFTTKRLRRKIGNPLAAVADGDEAWYEKTWAATRLRNKKLLYAAGTAEQPCGYWPHKHTNDAGETTDWPITGEWVDDASWPYICDPDAPAVVHVAIYPDRDCKVQRGQRLYAQEDDAV